MAIKKYMYVTVNRRFEDDIRISYSKTETADSVDRIEHGIVRECLRKVGIAGNIEVTTIADIPSRGTGLGSSSALTVGLLNALYAFTGHRASPKRLAEEACEIEIGILGKPIGKQDQYIAAFGNLRFIQFHPSGEVQVEPVDMDAEKKLRLGESLMLFFTGVTRSSSDILTHQRRNIASRLSVLQEMKKQACDIRGYLQDGKSDKMGDILHQAWLNKKQLAERITNPEIDRAYEAAREAGAIGGKIAGAGGGGFMLLYCHPKHQHAVRERLKTLSFRELPFSLERDGTKVIFNVRR